MESSQEIKELEENLVALLDYAAANLKFCREIFEQLAVTNPVKAGIVIDKTNPRNFYRTYIANLHFHEVIFVLNSLFAPSWEEISFKEYLKLKPNTKIERKVLENKTYILDEKLDKYRDKILAHKDIKSFGDPIFFQFRRRDISKIKKLEEIIKETKDLCSKEFTDLIVSNNIFLDNIKEGFELCNENK
jgi:hypothetical protein